MTIPLAFLSASWHEDLLAGCRQQFLAELAAQGYDTATVDQFTVPGSLEIPLMAQLLAETGKYSVIVAIGFIVDGGIYRHDFVAKAVIEGIVQVSLKTGVPVLSAVLTPHHFHEHATHVEFFREHLLIKGRELANSCLHTLRNLDLVKAMKLPDA